MRIQLKKYSEGRIKSSGTYAREQFEKSRATTGSTLGEGARRSVSFDDLDLSGDTDEGFGSIATRVLSLLVVGVAGAAVLFAVGRPFLR